MELFDSFSELGKLVGSPRREVEDVRQQHDRTVFEGLGQAHAVLAADGQLEIRRNFTNQEISHDGAIILCV